MNCLVTGAAGFVGSHLCSGLIDGGNKVWGIDDLSKGKLDNIEHLLNNPSFFFTSGSLADEALLFEKMQKADIIYHMAAVVGVKQYAEDPVKTIEVNTCQTLGLLKMAWQLRKKILFASTSEVYGKSREVPFKEEADRVYGSVGRWCYAVSKCAAEHLCLHYASLGLPLVIVRYFNVYGPKADNSAYGGVVARFIKQLLRKEPLTVHGDGSQSRCFTYIEDIVRGTVEAGNRLEAEGKTINLGNRQEISILELARIILQVSEIKGEIEFLPHKEFYGPNYEDIPRRVPDLSAAEKILGYHTRVSLEDGLQRTINWYRKKMA